MSITEITEITEPRTHGHITTDGRTVTYTGIPTTTYTATNDSGDELATIRVLNPTNEIVDATRLGSHFPGPGVHHLINLVESVALGRDLCVGEPAPTRPHLLNEIANHRELEYCVDLMTAEGIDAENDAVLTNWNAA